MSETMSPVESVILDEEAARSFEVVGRISLKETLDTDCSDIHLFPAASSLSLDSPITQMTGRVRKGGVLGPLVTVDIDVEGNLLDLLATPPKPDFSASLPSGRRIRVAVRSTRAGSAKEVFIRVLPENVPPAFSALSRMLPELDALTPGLTLISGITGSGKSTLLASVALRHLALGAHVVTVEDPIEYHIRSSGTPGYSSQREVGVDIPDFASGVKMSLREDPDTIIVGEVRDRETAIATLTAAETGHSVLATVHAGGCFGTVDRFLSLIGGEEFEAMRLAGSYLCGIHVSSRAVKDMDEQPYVERTYEIFRSNDAARTHIRERSAHRLWQARLGTSEKDWKLSIRCNN